ncbi:MAG: DUF1211 domain-containing protein [Methanobrevibacter sp.]|uniref:TMEM175 family protein n=1 Tax=Methanobrevibacter sp. TaxID=66852 RepID=UPI0025F17098|nr:TMEM175 family protein [Methanobrevibacter sp.]MBQ8017937.1 DUF1211 domain-containing protein [Methanobrevibacter sp.]
MNKDRVIALTDGIVAIAATIMVLELSVPSVITLDALVSQIPTLYAYIISFALVYLSWRSHHNAFEKADNINGKVFIINGIWLFFITLVPFVTGLIGNDPNSLLSTSLYIIVISLWTLTFQFLDKAIVDCNPGAERDEVRHNTQRILLFGSYIVGFAFCFIIPIISIIIIGLAILSMLVQILRENMS